MSTAIIDSLKKSITGVEDRKDSEIPHTINLFQNYPNPFNPTTKIYYEIPKASHVEIKIFDVLGRNVAVLVNEKKQSGKYSVNFDARNFSSGIYFYQIKADSYVSIRKMNLIK